MKTLRGILALLALFAFLCTLSAVPWTVKGRHWQNPRLDHFSIQWQPIWQPPSSEAAPAIRFDILVLEWLLIAAVIGTTAFFFRDSHKS